MKSSKEYHYVYYSFEEWGRGYIGSRSCKCLPEDDVKYLGSFRDKTFKPTRKIILKSDYSSRVEAYADEIILHNFYSVAENPHFANRCYQTSTSFSRKGFQYTQEEKQNLSEKMKGKHSGENNPMWGKKGRNNPMYGKKGENNPNYGKKKIRKTRKAISSALKGRIVSEKTKQKLRNAISTSRRREIAKRNAAKRLGIPLKEEHKRKIRESCKGKINMGEENGNYGKIWCTNGFKNVMQFKCPNGFKKGFVNKHNRKTWKITFDNGSSVVVEHLRGWCEENSYKVANIVNVKRGRIKKHKDIIKVEIIE